MSSGPIRALVVDDAVVVRRLVADVLGSDPDIEVVGTASDGRLALAKLAATDPDVVVLDVEMPVMDGMATLAAIRRERPRLPVIMFSTLTERGAAATLEALALGATDYVTKPANVGSVTLAMQRVREELIPKIRAVTGRLPRALLPGPALAGPRPARPARPAQRPEIVAVGTSTGGPNALAELLPALPGDLGVPVVVVQHMPPVFTKLLADRLAGKCQLRVAEGVHGATVEPGQVWIAPGDHHMVVRRDGTTVRLATNQDPQENSCRPAADVLFRSVADAYGGRALAVVLTGMGQDGLRGCERLLEGGGRVLAQDEASSVVWGMPGYVARAGLADRVLPLDQIANEIVRRVRAGRLPRPLTVSTGSAGVTDP
jgi:two-component system, chemotaxis family, protein-glutamate methylesterase/glutaminase